MHIFGPMIFFLEASRISGILFRNASYLDPGSGSYLLQILLAALLGGLFMLRMSWNRVTGFFRGLLGREEVEPEEDEEGVDDPAE